MGWDCDGDTLLVTGMGREQNSGDMTIYGRDRDMRWVLECQKVNVLVHEVGCITLWYRMWEQNRLRLVRVRGTCAVYGV